MTDIRMPGVDGMELIRRAKELRPDLVFIVVSGYRQFEYAQENRELNGYESLNQEYGCDFHEGTYQVIIIKPDIPSAEEHGDAYRIMMKRSLSVVQKALEQFADESGTGTER